MNAKCSSLFRVPLDFESSRLRCRQIVAQRDAPGLDRQRHEPRAQFLGSQQRFLPRGMADDEAQARLRKAGIDRLPDRRLLPHPPAAARPVPQLGRHHEGLRCGGKRRKQHTDTARRDSYHSPPVAGAGAGAGRGTRFTVGSDHLPVTSYSKEASWPKGSFSTFLGRYAATPATGPTTSAPAIATDSVSCGVILTLRFCVSCARSTSPRMTMFAAGPRTRKFSVLALPRSILTAPTISSKAT